MTAVRAELSDKLIESNSLADLAARINVEHEAAESAYRSGIEHALECGALLLQAKTVLSHGQWLPWLQSNCSVSSRSARLYMQLARNRPELEAKSATVANMTLQGAVRLLEPPQRYDLPKFEDFKDDEDLWEWAAQQIEEPFTDFDFEPVPEILHWLRTKIVNVAKLPAAAGFYLDADEYGVSAMAAISWDDLWEAITRLAPYVREKDAAILRVESSNPAAAATIIKLEAMWLLGKLLNEANKRRHVPEQELEQRGDAAHAEYMAAIGTALDLLGGAT